MSQSESRISLPIPFVRYMSHASGMPKKSEAAVEMNAISKEVSSAFMTVSSMRISVPIESTYTAGRKMKSRKNRMVETKSAWLALLFCERWLIFCLTH
jgi:hypothetical protein